MSDTFTCGIANIVWSILIQNHTSYCIYTISNCHRSEIDPKCRRFRFDITHPMYNLHLYNSELISILYLVRHCAPDVEPIRIWHAYVWKHRCSEIDIDPTLHSLCRHFRLYNNDMILILYRVRHRPVVCARCRTDNDMARYCME